MTRIRYGFSVIIFAIAGPAKFFSPRPGGWAVLPVVAGLSLTGVAMSGAQALPEAPSDEIGRLIAQQRRGLDTSTIPLPRAPGTTRPHPDATTSEAATSAPGPRARAGKTGTHAPMKAAEDTGAPPPTAPPSRSPRTGAQTPIDFGRCEADPIPAPKGAVPGGFFVPVKPGTSLGVGILAHVGQTETTRIVKYPKNGVLTDAAVIAWAYEPLLFVGDDTFALITATGENGEPVLRPRCGALDLERSAIQNRLTVDTELQPKMQVTITQGKNFVWQTPERAGGTPAARMRLKDLVVARRRPVEGWVLDDDPKKTRLPKTLGELVRPLDTNADGKEPPLAAAWLCRLDPDTKCAGESVVVQLETVRIRMAATLVVPPVAVEAPPPARPPVIEEVPLPPSREAPVEPPAKDAAAPPPPGPAPSPPPVRAEAADHGDLGERDGERGPHPAGDETLGAEAARGPERAPVLPPVPVEVKIDAPVPAGTRVRIFETPAACEAASTAKGGLGESRAVAQQIVMAPTAAAVLLWNDRPISECTTPRPFFRAGEGTSAQHLDITFHPMVVVGKRRILLFSLSRDFDERNLSMPIRNVLREWVGRLATSRARLPITIGAIDGDRKLRSVFRAEDILLMERMSEKDRDLAIRDTLRAALTFSYRSMQAVPDTLQIYDEYKDADIDTLVYVISGANDQIVPRFTGPIYTWLARQKIALTIVALSGCAGWTEEFGAYPNFSCRQVGSSDPDARFLRDILETLTRR